jgi:hypothetical protein
MHHVHEELLSSRITEAATSCVLEQCHRQLIEHKSMNIPIVTIHLAWHKVIEDIFLYSTFPIASKILVMFLDFFSRYSQQVDQCRNFTFFKFNASECLIKVDIESKQSNFWVTNEVAPPPRIRVFF